LGSVYKLSPWTEHDIVSKNWGVSEKVTTAYVKGDIDSKILDHAVRGNVGVQVINTKQSATGFRVDQASCNGDTHSCGYANVSGGTSYNDVLPSLNLVTDLGNDNVLRFGMGRVLARPNMEDMKATRDFSLDTTTGTPMLKGSGGNPNLQPFRADTIDLSWEKYFGKKGYFSVAGYYKDLKTYILKRSQVFDFANYITPGTVLPSGGSTMGLLTQASNGSGGSISGVEMALNVPFSMATSALDGFGVVVNTSLNNSSVSLPASGFSTSGVNTTNIPLPGLSKQVTNLRLYYEKSGLQMSVAARKRSDFLGSIADYQDNTQLVYIKGETQVDAQASYEFTQGQAKGLTLLVQGINLTNAEFAQYDAKTGNITDRKKFGPSMMFGASYKF
jgi:iron complex outermembrane recepter protein